MALAPNALVFSTIQFDQARVDRRLLRGVLSDQRFGDGGIDVGHGLQHPLAEIALDVAIPELQGLVFSRRGPRRHGSTPTPTATQGDIDFYRWIASRVQDLHVL